MQNYKRSLVKTDSIMICGILLLLLSPLIISSLVNTWGTYQCRSFWLLWCGVILGMFLLICSQVFYPIITFGKISIQHSIFRCWRKDFNTIDIDYIILGNTGGMTPDYIQIILSDRKSRRYVIDSVGRKNYPRLIKDLSDLGVRVEVKNIRLD